MSQTNVVRNISVSVVIPAKNEADNIHPLVNEICQSFEGRDDFEIIYVDDGSTDATAANVVKAAYAFPNKVKLVQHAESVGQSTSIYSGVHAARGTLIVTLDADGQNNPADIPTLLARAKTHPTKHCFCIAGYRKARKDTP